MAESRNLSARMAHWSAHHRKIAIFGWLAFCFVAFAFGTMALGVTSLDASNAGVRESGRMDRLLDKDFKTPAGERVIVQSRTLTANDPRFAVVFADVLRRLKANKTATNFTTPAQDTGLVSADRHSALIDFDVTGDPDTASDRVQPILDTTAAAQAAHSDFVVEEFGAASGDKQLNKVFTDDLKKAGELSIPITLGILLLAFGALVAAGIPLLLGLTAVIATMGLMAIPSKIFPMDDSIGAVVLLIGLAVGVDYTMFYLKREREERREGKSPEEALQIAAATSGRSVLISGITVMIAMAGLFLTGDPTFKGFGAATILVVAVAVIGSLTVLPATLSWLGDRVEMIHLPVVKSLRPEHGESRFWSAILGPVLRHPIPAIALSAGFLLILCGVALQLKTVVPGADTYPQSLPVVKTYNKMQKAFPGGETPAEVVIKADNVRSVAVKEAIGQLSWRALITNVMHEPILTDVNKSGTVAVVSIPRGGLRDRRHLAEGRERFEGRDPPEHARPCADDRRLRGDRRHGELEGLQRPDGPETPVRVRLRDPPRLPALDDHVPVDRHPHRVDRAQPVVGRSLLRRPRARLPGRDREGDSQLLVHRRCGRVHTGFPLRDPLRALDGLPRLHPEPDS